MLGVFSNLWPPPSATMRIINRTTQIFRKVNTVQVSGGHFVNAKNVYYTAPIERTFYLGLHPFQC
jgi:hypothetical protein